MSRPLIAAAARPPVVCREPCPQLPFLFSDTQGGAFGDGECKIVRSLTRPPMVNGLVEFVTLMHARRLRPEDARTLDGRPLDDDDDGGGGRGDDAEGYLLVSRAVLGGRDAGAGADASGRVVRSEILLGANVLRAVPGDPRATELTTATHLRCPLVPPLLAKGAGVRGAADFVRDLRAVRREG